MSLLSFKIIFAFYETLVHVQHHPQRTRQVLQVLQQRGADGRRAVRAGHEALVDLFENTKCE